MMYMGKRINFTISDVQVERMEDLCKLHGYQNVSQCCKYLLQRGLTIECASAGILTTNDRLAEMAEVLQSTVADPVVPPQSLKFENPSNQESLKFDDN